ncbi:hypothetical protein FVQ98_12185 [Ottowia sp. GY511]|uniref:Uncharacterized protein n=1 Tax=Ottowia flava TaxID=2675430 RepID=A0ABW4KYW2_9BURK|nr:hypothetical protein [Ottowia sp. GY511]TXK27026.1 hypothetical protein FVQ98_12185 [Ottowia sp. GY511]
MLIRLIQRALAPSAQGNLQRATGHGNCHATRLMETAEASAGTDPRRAAELRSAALAYLGVVR